jgi:hypothetical protein
MKKNGLVVTVLCSLLVLVGLISGSTAVAKDLSAVKTVALVSLTVSDMNGSVSSGAIGDTPAAILISASVNDMIVDAETKLAKKWAVTKVSSFIDNAEYKKAGVEKTLTVFVPKVDGKEMPVFTQVSKEIKGGIIDPQKAKDLCKALNVDGVVVIFSEWVSKTGGFVPTTKALSKNIFSLWDKNGNQVVKERVDMMGNKTLGMGGFAAVNKETIEEWRDSYNRSLDKIMSSL